MDCFLVKKILTFTGIPINISQQGWLPIEKVPKQAMAILPSKSLFERNQNLQESYFIFAIAIALLSIALEIVLTSHARMIRKHNQVLLQNNRAMVEQNTELQHTLAQLEESREENVRMLQVIAHDLRSPMAAIVGLSGFMIEEQKLEEEDQEVIRLIHTSGVDSLKFINDILEKEPAHVAVKKDLVDLQAMLIYCIEQLKYKAREKNQQLVVHCRTKVQLALNREKIWRVIHNLIANALKFSPYQSTITVSLEQRGNRAIIAVADEGIGIPEELGRQIFGGSAEHRREGTAGEKSFGMGLGITKQMIEAHGGKLHFTSEVGKGTTFFVDLPLP